MEMYAWQHSIDVVQTKVTIKKLRKAKGLKIADLEEYFGFCPQTFYKWEDVRNTTLPSLENLYALAKLLDVQLDDILVPKFLDSCAIAG